MRDTPRKTGNSGKTGEQMAHNIINRKGICCVELANMSENEMNAIEPIDKPVTDYRLAYYLNLKGFYELVRHYKIDLDDLGLQLTEVIALFLSNYPNGKPCAVKPTIRVDKCDGKKQQLAIYVDYS